MKNFSKCKSWLMLMIFGLMFTMSSAFAQDVSLTGTDLGNVPEGAFWLEDQTITITNDAVGSLVITDVQFEESNEYFSVNGFGSTMPATLAPGGTLDVYVNCAFPTLDPNVDYEKDLIVAYNSIALDFEAFPITASSYNSKGGDVVENAIDQTVVLGSWQMAATAGGGSGATNVNYNTPHSGGVVGNTKDRVWKITAAQDMLIALGQGASVADAFAIAVYGPYAAGDDVHPMDDNALASSNGTSTLEVSMYEGSDYYIVLTYDFDRLGQPHSWADYMATAMTAPVAALKTAPVDEDLDVMDTDMLKWQYQDTQAQKYRVLLSGEVLSDPIDDSQIFVDWTDVDYSMPAPTAAVYTDEVALTGALENNRVYFWRVDLMNNVDETLDPDYFVFTTEIDIPQNLTYSPEFPYTDDDIVLSWDDINNTSGEFIGYNVYGYDPSPISDDGLTLLAEEITEATFNAGEYLYNMGDVTAISVGYEFYVTAVFEVGESDPSTSVFVTVNDYQDITGTVTDDVSGDPLEGVLIGLTVTATEHAGEPVDAYVFTATTDAAGEYTISDVPQGVFDVDAFVSNYVPYEDADIDLDAPSTLVYDFGMTLMPAPEAAIKIAPADQSVGVSLTDELEWEYGEYALEYRILLSTENVLDPMIPEHVLVDWTQANPDDAALAAVVGSTETYTLATGDIDFNQVYFWRVDFRNLNEETIDPDKWDFTSGLTKPNAFAVVDDKIFTDEDAVLTWEAPDATKALLGYEVFQDGVSIAVTSDLTYSVTGLAYEMTDGYDFTVRALYNEGESAETMAVNVMVSSYGTISGTITETSNPTVAIDGADVAIAGLNEFGEEVAVQETTSDVDGMYEFGVVAKLPLGVYDLAAMKYSFKPYMAEDLTIDFDVVAVSDLDWSFTMDDVDAPNVVVKVAPVQEQEGVVVTDLLVWEYNDIADVQFTEEYRVLLSTEAILDAGNPEHVLVDWTAVGSTTGDSYELTAADIDPNQVYFWRVDLRNMNGTTIDANKWDFTTLLNSIDDLAAVDATIFTDETLVLNWTDPTAAKAFLGYDVYQDDVLLNTTGLVTATTYEVSDLAYNMAGYDFHVNAVYDEGESLESNTVTVQVSSYGDISGIVTDATTGLPIQGATVAVNGTDEFLSIVTGSATTSATGAYLFDGIELGDYNLTFSADGYVDDALLGLNLMFGTDITDADMALLEFAFPPQNVVATANGADVDLTWEDPEAKALVDYDAQRIITIFEPGTTPTTPVYIGSTTGNYLLDDSYAAQLDAGIYFWQVMAIYDNTTSAWATSNRLEKDMGTTADITIATAIAGDDPTATVTFDYIGQEVGEEWYTAGDYDEEVELGVSGVGSISDLRKGTYNISVELDGYQSVDFFGVVIWDDYELDIVLNPAVDAPVNFMVDNDSLYLGETATFTWEAANSQLQGFNFYWVGAGVGGADLLMNDNPLTETTYSVDPTYNMVPGNEFYVTAVYSEVAPIVESGPSASLFVKVTGEGAVAGNVLNGLDDSPLKDVQVRLEGVDEYGVDVSYLFTTDGDGEFTSITSLLIDGVLAGTYDVTFTKENYATVKALNQVVNYNTLTNWVDVYMFPDMTVVALELDADNVELTWEFDVTNKELLEYQIYRAEWDAMTISEGEFMGLAYGQIFIDDSWDDFTWGAYKWAVVSVYDNGTTVAWSNVLLKDMEVATDVTVTLNTLESPEGTEVDMKYLNGFMDTTYTATLDATGMFTFDPIYKGDYEIKVKLFGYETVYEFPTITSDTAFEFELIENLTPVSDLYVTPNGYATWGVAQPEALEMFESTFDTEIPSNVTIETYSGQGWTWNSDANDNGYAFAKYGYPSSESVMMFPPVIVEATTVINFDYAVVNWFTWGTSDIFEVYISTNGGLTFTQIWDATYPAAQSEWVPVSIALADHGVTDGEVIVAVYKYDANGADWGLDNAYIGAPETATSGPLAQLAIDETDERTTAESNATPIGIQAIANNSKSLENFKVYLDDTFATDTENEFFDYEVDGPVVLEAGEEYTARVDATYTTGESESMFYTFVYLPCDSFNKVEDLAATRVLGTTDINLTWTNDNAFVGGDEFAGTMIYANGMFVAEVEAGVTTYTDSGLESGVYTYCLTQVYESGAESCETCAADVEMTLGGYVNGYVTEFDGGAAIEGAIIAMVPTVGLTEFYFVTDVDGYYEGEVLEGTYTYTVTADTYESVMEADVIVDFGATVVKDFFLKEFPYAVGYVMAEELSSETVKVTWGGESAPPIGEWLTYDDGVNWNALGNATAVTMSWAIKFDPAQLTAFNESAVTEIEGYIGAEAATTIFARVWSGAEAATLLYEEDVTSQISWDAWNTITLATAVEFDNAEELWIGFYGEDAGASYPAGLSNTAAANANGDLYNSGAGWLHASALGAGDLIFNVSGYVTNVFGAKTALNPRTDNTPYKVIPSVPYNVISAAAPTYKEEAIYASSNTKDFVGYNIYRVFKGEAATAADLLGSTLDESFNDNTWGTADWGMYQWGVETVYTNNASVIVYSNDLDKDMNTVVNMEVSTTSGDSPGGASVLFENTLEELEDITTTIPGSGLKTIDPFRRGTYDITVSKSGFVTLNLEDVVIHDTTDFVWVLVEDLVAPSNLYVTPTGLATWSAATGPAFEPFMENFDAADSFDNWEVIVGGSTADSWFWNDGTNGQYPETLDGTPYAFVDSDDAGSGTTMDEMLISPIIDASNAGELFLEFDQFLNNLATNELADVAVYNGSEWITVLSQVEDHGGWSAPDHVVIDVTEYANAEFRVSFHYVSPGWNWHWAVDNVVVTDEAAAKSSKEIVEYLVYHEGVNTNNVQDPIYQYGEVETEVLVSGETYTAEVAAAYSTGISEKALYVWTYLPCTEFANYNSVMAANVDGTNDVLVEWSMVESPMSEIEINQGYGDPSNGYFQNFGFGYGVAFDFTAYPDALVSAVDFHHASWGLTGNWEFKIHVIDWDTKVLIETVGPFTSAMNDDWENGIDLGSIDCGGATMVAVLMEPMGNSAADAYPDLSSDSDTDPQGSIFGDLSDYTAIGASGIGNFLMNVHIMTANADAPSSPVVISSVEGPMAQSRVESKSTFSPEQVITQNVTLAKEFEVLGVNVYRDGAMLAFVPSPDTFLLDMDLAPGLYDYCVSSVYTDDAGLHTWETCTDLCIEDVLVPEECVAPMNLVAQDLLGDGYTATLTWGSIDPQNEWLFYDDDNMTYTGIGAEASDYSLIWAVKFTPDMLEAYTPGYVTKIAVFQGASVGDYLTEARVMSGDGMNVLYTQDVTGTLVDGWNEIELDEAVAFDNSDNLWVGFYVERPGGTANEPTSLASPAISGTADHFAYNGAPWTSIEAEYGISGQTFMVRGYVTNSAGKTVALGNVENDYTEYTTSTSTGVAMIPADPNFVGEKFDFGTSSRGFLGYNIYRDGSMIEENWPTTGYEDDLGESVEVCYTVSANYEFCGESDMSNEACVTVGVGVGNLVNAISVYPNPAKDYVTVEATSDILTIKVTNYMGQVISYIQNVEVTSHTIATSSYSSGVYFVEVETATGVEKVRIVISE